MIEERKKIEALFHNKIRDEELRDNKFEYEKLTANKKFYSITRKSRNFVKEWLLKRCKGKKVLDYCCGNGEIAIFLAKNGAEVIGIDISEVSIEIAKKNSIREGVNKNTTFLVMDAENLEFEDNYFDIIICSGVLHHLDVKKAYPELARVIKTEGEIICNEPLAYNPIFQLYRRMTPHLRTKWEMEHILNKNDINLAKKYFNKIEIKFFHLSTLLAVPFQNTFLFNPFLSLLEKIDSILLKFPFLKWFSWQIIFILSEPKKSIPQPKDLQEGLSGDLITKESQAYKRISNGISLTRIIAMFWIVSVNYFQLVFKNFYNQEYPDAVAKTQNFIEVMKNSHFIDKIFLPFFYSGWSGVVIFVIISGFSLWLSILVSKKFKIGEYIIERFNGIYVPYFVAVIISIFVNYYFLKGTPQPYVLPALLLGAAKFVPAAQWVNSPLWFISLILVCYLFFPIIPIIYNKFRLIGILVITIISSIVMFYLWDVFHTTTVRGVTNPILSSLYPLFPFWAFLCIGVLLCHLIYKSIMIQLRKTIQEYVKILLPLFFVIVGTIFLFKILYLDPSKNSEIPWQINPWLAGMAGTLVFLSAGYLLPVRFYRILRWLSRGTFTVFLYHYVASPLVVKHISPNIILTPHISIAIILMYLAMLIGFSVCQSFVDNTLVKFVKSLCKKDYEIV